MTAHLPTSTRTSQQSKALAEKLRHLDEHAREAMIEQKLRLRPGAAEILLSPPSP
jgi:hypothetical protein